MLMSEQPVRRLAIVVPLTTRALDPFDDGMNRGTNAAADPSFLVTSY